MSDQSQFPGFDPNNFKGMMDSLNHWMENGFRLMDDLHKNNIVIHTLPMELWESEEHYTLLICLPGIKNNQDLKVTLKDQQTIKIRARNPILKPEKDSKRILSGFPNQVVEREIRLPHPVSTKNFSSSYKGGVLHLRLQKKDEILDRIVFED